MRGSNPAYQLMDINKLAEVNGEGTTLVTLLLPADYNISQAKELLVSERSESKNIKDKSTRKKVEAALKKAQSQVRQLGEIPENGAAIFTKHDNAVTYIPKKQLNEKLYRCDNRFHTEPIQKLERDDTRYGIIVADRDYYRVGEADTHGNTTRLREKASGIPSKHSKGGQSAQRFERSISEKKKKFVKEIADEAQKHFLKKLRNGNLLGIVISGTLNQDIKSELNGELEQETVAETHITQSIPKTVQKIQDELVEEKTLKLEEAKQKFKDRVAQETHTAEYGEQHVSKAADMGAVETLIVPEGQYV